MSESIMNPRLLTLLRFAKSERSGSTWRDVAQALGDLYHPEMTLADVIHHLVAAYSEVLCEPRFEVGRSGKASEELLLAPIKGFHSIDFAGPRSLTTPYTVEQFYNAFVLHILGQLSITSIGWCRAWFDGTTPSLPPLEVTHA